MSSQPDRPSKPPVTRRDIHAGAIEHHIEHIAREFRDGFELLRQYPKSVSIFGSSLSKPDNPDYLKAQELARRIVTELGYTIVTGGGPGIMEAANKGAYEAGGSSAGLSISLPHEHKKNGFTTNTARFSYFFTRKTMLTFAAEAYVFFPGGYGTFDELFSILTLIQTGKIPRVPVLLYDTLFWSKFTDFMEKTMIGTHHTIDEADLKFFEVTNSLDRILECVSKAPVAEWWRNIN